MLKQVVEKVQGTIFLPPDDYSPPKETVKQNGPQSCSVLSISKCHNGQ